MSWSIIYWHVSCKFYSSYMFRILLWGGVINRTYELSGDILAERRIGTLGRVRSTFLPHG